MEGARFSLIVLAGLWVALPAWAQDNARVARGQVSNPRLLLLTDGQLLEYPWESRVDGYEVELPGGPQFVESSRVLCTASSRTDAWRQLRSTFQSLTPDVHMQLARWCLRYELHDAAERELLDALHLDPNRADAKQLLQQVTGRRLAAVRSVSPQESGGMIPGAPGLSAPPAARSLGGLTADHARGFVRQVQPLLSNRCAAAGCHGPGATSEFRFTSIRNGSTPLAAERNLAAVLNQITPSDPLMSPLLQRADELHGGMTEPAFRGRTGAQQRQNLRNWVESVVKDLYPEAAPPESSSDLQPAFAAMEDSVSEASAADHESDSSLPHGRRAVKAEDDRRFLQQAARAVARDPFSPAAFNRRFHGQPKSESAGEPETADPDTDLSLNP